MIEKVLSLNKSILFEFKFIILYHLIIQRKEKKINYGGFILISHYLGFMIASFEFWI